MSGVSNEPITQPAAPSPAVVEPVVAAPAGRSRAMWLALAALVLALAVGALAYTQLANVKRETARRVGELQQAAAAATETAVRADAEARSARQQAAVLEARLAEVESQREALEQLYADLSRGRDEAVLVEVERLITLGAQELQITGNVPTALAALQTADARLARLESPRFVPLRRVLARDIERLKAAPAVDITGIALKIDQLIAGSENWPLMADATPPAAAATPARPGAAPVPPPPSPLAWWERTWDALQRELGEYRDLVRIRVVDTPDAMLLGQQQQGLVRQQLRLRLLNARQALLGRNDRLYRADLAEAQALMNRYFDVRQRDAASALASMKQLASAPLSVETPNINDSVSAVRAVRTAPVNRP
jgi:uroporphyrin-3 C-methyltransferase/uroporphyrinogen III methyltransferase/synthase